MPSGRMPSRVACGFCKAVYLGDWVAAVEWTPDFSRIGCLVVVSGLTRLVQDGNRKPAESEGVDTSSSSA